MRCNSSNIFHYRARRRSISGHFAVFASIVLAGLAILLGICGTARAGAWAQQEGKTLAITSLSYYRADTDFDVLGNRIDDGSYHRFETTTLIEHGLTSADTLGGKFTFKAVGITSNGLDALVGSGTGVSDAEIFWRHQFFKMGPWVFAMQGQIGFSTNEGPRGTSIAFRRDGLDGELRALIGKSIRVGSMPGFINVEGAYRYRSGAASDEIRLDATFGIEQRDDVLVLLQLFSTVGMRNAEPGGADYDSLKLQPSFVWSMTEGTRLQIGGTFELGGRNIPKGQQIFGALWMDF